MDRQRHGLHHRPVEILRRALHRAGWHRRDLGCLHDHRHRFFGAGGAAAITAGVDGVFASSGPDTAGVIVKQIREAGLALPILAGDGFDTDLLVSVPGPTLATNVYFTNHAYVGLETGPADTFRAAYEAEYGRPPENAFAALGYDAMGLVADAITRAGSSDPKAVSAALAATSNYADAVTGAIAYIDGSRVPSKRVAIMQVDAGKITLNTTVTPRS
ncbi:ABC transporter substrate-binding protein [Paracoccaceae bacterium Fryx2]|nr:ABC transporter substrate-binding protein [Paracoccaceae bacterium Fryx2]